MSSSPPIPRPTLRESVAFTWRTLRSMRTALILLLLLAFASVGGSLIPQVPNSPQRVAAYFLDHPFWAQAFRAAGLFDVFGSWWFGLIVVLLFVSLVACLLPRSRAHWRAIRTKPVHAREIDAFALYAERPVPASPVEAAVAARRVLRRKRFRVAGGDGALVLAAEKGILREAGSLVFHWAFVLLLVGVVVGKGTGYSGQAPIVEGTSWTDAAINYNTISLREGRFFDGHFSGLGIHLVRFQDTYDLAIGMPTDFVSTIQLLDRSGQVARTQDVRVNHPAVFGGLRIFQFGFGWAPVVSVRDGGTTVSEAPIVMGQGAVPKGRSQLSMPWQGFVKLPSIRPDLDMAVKLELWPDGRSFFNPGMPMFSANEPLMRYTVYEGKLLDPSLSSLDTRLMHETAQGFLWQGLTVDLERGCMVRGPALSGGQAVSAGQAVCPAGSPAQLVMAFPELRRYSVLQVSKDTTVPVVLAAAILILLGLLAGLYGSRRKLWVRVDARDGGSVVKVGGFALQHKSQFEGEFARVVEAIVRAAAAP